MTDEITREEAKEVIQRIRNCVGEFKPTSFIHFPIYKNTIPALDMAIKSLGQDIMTDVLEVTKIEKIQELQNESYAKGFADGKEEGLRVARQGRPIGHEEEDDEL